MSTPDTTPVESTPENGTPENGTPGNGTSEDDARRRFREALERKQRRGAGGAGGSSEPRATAGSRGDGAHGQRMFRRKSG